VRRIPAALAVGRGHGVRLGHRTGRSYRLICGVEDEIAAVPKPSSRSSRDPRVVAETVEPQNLRPASALRRCPLDDRRTDAAAAVARTASCARRSVRRRCPVERVVDSIETVATASPPPIRRCTPRTVDCCGELVGGNGSGHWLKPRSPTHTVASSSKPATVARLLGARRTFTHQHRIAERIEAVALLTAVRRAASSPPPLQNHHEREQRRAGRWKFVRSASVRWNSKPA